jgi:hypothetical protein
MGPMIYRIAFEPIAHSSVLVLLMAAFGVHFSLMGLGLLFFGPEGTGTAPLSSASFSLGDLVITGQSVALRHRIPDRPERFYRRDHRRPGQLSAHRGRGAGGRHASKPSPRSMPAISRRSSSSR